jgi:hypothetical protein
MRKNVNDFGHLQARAIGAEGLGRRYASPLLTLLLTSP